MENSHAEQWGEHREAPQYDSDSLNRATFFPEKRSSVDMDPGPSFVMIPNEPFGMVSPTLIVAMVLVVVEGACNNDVDWRWWRERIRNRAMQNNIFL